MTLKIWVTNFLLAVFAVALGMNAYKIWTQPDDYSKNNTVSSKNTPVEGETASVKRMPVESVYGVVTDKNLFSPERKEFIPEKPKDIESEVKQVSISGQTVMLHGVILMGDYKKALINNPDRKSGDSENLWVSVGDSVGDLRVDDIQNESIVLKEGDKKYEILLYDQKKTRRPSEVVKKETAPTVINTAPQKPEPKVEAPAPEAAADGEYEMVKTPFGTIKRRKQ
jgi:hypothetical protein